MWTHISMTTSSAVGENGNAQSQFHESSRLGHGFFAGHLPFSLSLATNSHQRTQQNHQIDHHTFSENTSYLSFKTLQRRHNIIRSATYSKALPSTINSSIQPIVILHSSHQPNPHIYITHESPHPSSNSTSLQSLSSTHGPEIPKPKTKNSR